MFNSTKLKKWTSLVVTLLMVFTVFSPFPKNLVKAADPNTFDLIEITDFHGSLEDTSTPANPVAGVLAKAVKAVKTANPDRTLILGGGDLYQGSALSNMTYGKAVEEVMTNIGMEVTAVGNHEFDWGLNKITDETMQGASYEMICANLIDKTTNKPVFKPYKVITKDNVKIAVIGAITTETPTIVSPSFVSNYNFTDPVTEINKYAKQIRDNKEADVVVALIHEGSNSDCKTGKIFDIANSLTGVDAVLGGHSHTIVQTTAADGKTPIAIAGSNGKGYVDLQFTYDGTKPTFTNATSCYKAITYKGVDPATACDSEVMAIVQKYKDQLSTTLNKKLGTTDTVLTRDQDASPWGESYLGNWVCDVIRSRVNADVAFQNNGGIRCDIPAGDITYSTIYTLMPFDNTICTVDMTKAQIMKVLEQAFADTTGKGIQMSGLKVYYNPNNPSGSRVVNITREDGTTIKETDKLHVAACDFMITGGDGFTGFVDAGSTQAGTVNPKNDTHILVRDALMDNVRANNGIKTTMDKRMQPYASSIQILGTSDIHGNIYPIDYATEKPANYGLAKVSTVVNNIRKLNPNVMLVDSGDLIQGTPLSYYYDKLDTTSEYPLMKVMGAMKYDSWTLGNHEFNYGLDTLNRVLNDSKKEGVPVLSANIYNTKDDSNFVKPYITKTFNINGKDVKVGILGLTTKCIPNWENTTNYAGLKFNDLVTEAQKWVPVLKNTEKCDYVIATIHSGEEGASDTIPENQVKAVINNTTGIDAVICGHAHSVISRDLVPNANKQLVPVTEPGKWGQDVSEVDIMFNNDGSFGGITTKLNVIDDSVQADPAILTLAQPYEDATLKYTNTVIGKSTGEYSGKDQLVKPTALMDLINKVQMQYAGTQLSIAAPLSNTAYIPAGDIKIKDIMSVYVFENFLYGVKMNGKQLKNWLEYSVRYYKQVKSATDPIAKDTVLNIPDYNLDFLYGASYDVDLTQPACTVENGVVTSGNRIKNLMYNGKLIKDTDVFTVAINNYRYNGGGGFVKAAGLTIKDANGKDIVNPSLVMYDSQKALGDDGQVRNMMINYVTANKTITPTCSNNWDLSATPVAQKQDTPATPSNPLPKTGSVVNTETLVSLGLIMALLGAAYVYSGKRKEELDEE